MTSKALDADAKRFDPGPSQGNIYVVRSGGPGSAITLQILFDGRVVGSLAPDTYQMFSAAPGMHVVSTGGPVESVQLERINVEAGRNYFLQAGFGWGWWAPRTKLELIGEDEGRKAVARSKRAEAITY